MTHVHLEYYKVVFSHDVDVIQTLDKYVDDFKAVDFTSLHNSEDHQVHIVHAMLLLLMLLLMMMMHVALTHRWLLGWLLG